MVLGNASNGSVLIRDFVNETIRAEVHFFPNSQIEINVYIRSLGKTVQGFSLQAKVLDHTDVVIHSTPSFTLFSDGTILGIPRIPAIFRVPGFIIRRASTVTLDISAVSVRSAPNRSVRAYLDGVVEAAKETMEVKEMDAITAVQVLGSIASIASVMQQNGEVPTVAEFVRRVRSRLAGDPSINISSQEDEQQIEEIARAYIEVQDSFGILIDRLNEICLKPLNDAYEEHAGTSPIVFDERNKARRCVCDILQLIRLDNRGQLPSDELRKLSERFECHLLT